MALTRIMDKKGDKEKMEEFFEEKKKIKQIQETIFPIICDIDDFCKEKGIQYYLCAGTCLGADFQYKVVNGTTTKVD